MASKTSASASFFLVLSILLLLLSLSSSCGTCPGSTPKTPSPKTPSPKRPSPGRSPSASGKCPADTLKLGVCLDVLGGLINLNIGTPPKTPCCTLLGGLADLEAAVCLCTVIRANVLGLSLNIPVDLSLLLNYCGRTVPSGFQCA